MKTVFGALATVALLFSLPALATDLADKSAAKDSKENQEKKIDQCANPDEDTIIIENNPRPDASVPICRGQGG